MLCLHLGAWPWMGRLGSGLIISNNLPLNIFRLLKCYILLLNRYTSKLNKLIIYYGCGKFNSICLSNAWETFFKYWPFSIGFSKRWIADNLSVKSTMATILTRFSLNLKLLLLRHVLTAGHCITEYLYVFNMRRPYWQMSFFACCSVYFCIFKFTLNCL